MRALLASFLRGRLTMAGAVFSLTILLIAIAAFASANNLLFLLLAAMLSTLLVSGFISRLGLAGLELHLQMPEHIMARRKTSARLMIRNTKNWMPSFSIHLSGGEQGALCSAIYFPSIPGGAVVEEPVDVMFRRRGTHKESNFRLSTRFPFGFTERHVDVTLQREFVVYPSVDAKPEYAHLIATIAGELEAGRRGYGFDFHRIRPYERFDSARHVDWKATAHTRELQVREFARETDSALCVILDRDVPVDLLGWLEEAIECAACLCWTVWLRGGRLRFVTQDADFRVPEDADAYAVLKHLALTQPAAGRPLAAPPEITSTCVVFSASNSAAEGLGRSARLVSPKDLKVPESAR